MMAKPFGMRRVFNDQQPMRPSLHILTERRRQRAGRAPARRTSGPARGRSDRTVEQQLRPARPGPTAAEPDRDVRPVRDSGGPLDRALYSCSCGYVFDAAVSTTVSCPHCGTGQAW